MKELGFPVKFSKKDNSYYYSEPGKLANVLFEKDEVQFEDHLSKNDLKKISGGKNYFELFPKSDYIRLQRLNFEE